MINTQKINNNINNIKISFIGSGNMARAIVSGLIQHDIKPNNIWVSSPHLEENSDFKIKYAVNITQDNALAAQNADALIFAVKPNILKTVIEPLALIIEQKKILIISVAAGVSTTAILSWLKNPSQPLIRAMPNTPALINSGITGLYTPTPLSTLHETICTQIFSSIGVFKWLEDEKQLDIITALSGSGPGFLFYIVNAMVQAASRLGLSEKTARQFALETLLGSAKLALHQNNVSLQTLKENVTSKGGTTEAGLKVAEENHIDTLVENMIKAAFNQAQILSTANNKKEK